MNKKELRCKHRHVVKEHPQCFMNGKLIDDAQWWKKVRMGYFDLETTGLRGDYDFVISWCIFDPKEDVMYSDTVQTEDIISGNFDKKVIKSLLKTMSKFDVLVTYYGTRFDIPFARTRAYANGFEFFNMGTIKHIDVYNTVRSRLSLTRNSLEKACALFGIEGKNHISAEIWRRASFGNPKAIAYVLDHNMRDVRILRSLFEKLSTQSRFEKRSI